MGPIDRHDYEYFIYLDIDQILPHRRSQSHICNTSTIDSTLITTIEWISRCTTRHSRKNQIYWKYSTSQAKECTRISKYMMIIPNRDNSLLLRNCSESKWPFQVTIHSLIMISDMIYHIRTLYNDQQNIEQTLRQAQSQKLVITKTSNDNFESNNNPNIRQMMSQIINNKKDCKKLELSQFASKSG